MIEFLHITGRRRGMVLLLLLAAFVGPRPAVVLAAPSDREVRVAFEPSGRLLEVDRVLARQLGLFVDEYPGFQTARLYQTGDSTFVLEMSIADGAAGSRERIAMTLGEVTTLRRDIAARMATAAPRRLLDQEGRPMLVAGATMLSFGYYGWAVPVAFEVGDPSAAVGLYMLVSGAGFLVPFAATSSATVTVADADLALYGASRGIAHGLLLREALDPDHEIDPDHVVGIGMAASLVEAVSFYAWSRTGRMDPGATGTIGTLGDYGALSAIGLASVAAAGDDVSESAVGVSGLAGSAVGLVAGRIFSRGRPLTRGDAGVMRTGTITAAYAGATIGEFLREDGGPDDPWIIGAIAGGAGGFAVGNALVRGRDFTHGQSRMVAYGTAAGALVGLGFAFVTEVDDGDAVLGMTSAGALLGFAGVYGSLREAALADARPVAEPRAGEAAARLTWMVNPVGAFALASGRVPDRGAPLAVLHWRFGEAR